MGSSDQAIERGTQSARRTRLGRLRSRGASGCQPYSYPIQERTRDLCTPKRQRCRCTGHKIDPGRVFWVACCNRRGPRCLPLLRQPELEECTLVNAKVGRVGMFEGTLRTHGATLRSTPLFALSAGTFAMFRSA